MPILKGAPLRQAFVRPGAAAHRGHRHARSCGCSRPSPQRVRCSIRAPRRRWPDRFIVFRDEYGAVSRLCWNSSAPRHWPGAITSSPAPAPCTRRTRSTTSSSRSCGWPSSPTTGGIRCSCPACRPCGAPGFLDRENLAGYRARLRFNERAAAELLEQATALMAQAKACHDELETYYRAAVDFGKVDEAAAKVRRNV